MIQDWLKRLRVFWSASRRNQIVVAAIGLLVLALIVGALAQPGRGRTSAVGIAQATATATIAAPPTATVSTQPTATAAPAGTPLPTRPVAQGIVGGTEAGFTRVYGTPTGTGVDSGNNLPTVSYRGTGPIGDITMEMDSSRSYVVGVVISAQKNTPWDATTIQAICPHFAPTDAIYDQAQTITNGSNQEVGIYQLGHSALLASSLPSSVFTDNQGQLTEGGTFTTEVYYIEGSSGKLAYACSLRLGNQPTSPGA